MAAAYLNLAWGYGQTDIEKSMDYALKTLDLAIPLDGWRAVADAYAIIGMLHYGQSENDNAMLSYGKALEAVERMRDFPEKYTEKTIDDELAFIHGNMGNLHNMQGKFHEAIGYYTEALKIFEKYDFKESQTVAYESIGAMYLAMENWEQAELNYLKADDLAHITGDSMMMANVKEHLSNLYLSTKEYDRALVNAEAARVYYFAHPEEEPSQISVLNTLAQIYLDGYDDVAQAEAYVRQALQLAQTNETHLVDRAASLTLLAQIHLRRGEWRAARDTALDALATNDSEPVNTLTTYGILAQANAYLGNADQSALYFNRHDSLRSSWATRHYQSAIRDMEVKYETEKKETRIATLEDERRLMVWLGIAAGVVLVLALVALLLLWRWTAQRKRLAEQHIVQLEQEKQLVATQAVLDGEIAERIRLSRDLHDGLGSMLTGVKFNLDSLKGVALAENEKRCFTNARKILDDSMVEMRRVAHHLMPDSLSQYGLKAALKDFCGSLPGIEFGWFGSDESLGDHNREVMIYRIVHELVNNAIKHSGAGRIAVNVMREADYIAFTVFDDGHGFDPATVTQGLGLQSIRERVASGGGRMEIDTGKGRGTEINVEFKIEG